VFALAMLLPAAAHADATLRIAEVLHFRQINERDGLSQSTARALAQDRLGFVWIGTQDGLNRFDGAHSEIYRRGDGSGLSDNHILALAVAGDDLWVGTQAGGLLRHEGQSGRFVQIADDLLPPSQMVPALAVSPQAVYAGLEGRGLLRFDLASGGVTVHERPAALRAIRVLRWRAGTLAIGTRDGLLLWPDEAAEPSLVPIEGLRSAAVPALDFGADGRLWFGLQDDGVRVLRQQPEGLYIETPDIALASPQVRSLLLDRRDRLWVGTEAGLTRFDPATAEVLTARHDAGSETSLPANRLPALMEDSEGLIWVGSWTAGLGIYRPDSEAVRLYRHFAEVPQSLPANPIRALLPEADGTLWLGVQEQGGLVHFDPRHGVLARYRHDPDDPASLPDDRVETLLRRRDGSLWVGSPSGLAKLRADGSFDRFRHDPKQPGSLPSNSVVGLYEDPDQTLWVGLADLGLVLLCQGCDQFEPLSLASDSPVRQVQGRINQIMRSRDGYFWFAGMPNGLYRYDPLRRRLLRYSRDPDDPTSLSHDSITVMVEDRSGRLWLGTQGGGLVEVERNERGEPVRFRAISRAEGLSGDAVGGLLEAPDGAIWAATISGLSRLDPVSGELRNLDASFGELARGYFIGASAVGADGVYYFGGLRGLTALRPGLLPPARGLPELRLTGVALDNTPIDRIAQPDLLDAPVVSANRIVVPPGYGVLGVEFAALDFLAPESLRYEYRLAGLDDNWLETPASRRYAAFTRLPAGRYDFELRVGRAGQDEQMVRRAVEVVVLAPLWKRPLALLAYLLLASVIGLVLLRRYRQRQLRESAARLALSDSEERLKLALWGSRDELWDIDLVKGVMYRENPIPELRLSAQPARSIDDYLSLVHPDDVERTRTAFVDHVSGRSDHYDVTYRGLAVDGGWRWLLARGRAVRRNEAGRAERIAGTVRDISESKAAEAALKSLADELESRVEARTADHRMAIAQLKRTVEELTLTQKQLVESEKMASLGQLVAGVAHEINTPIGIGVTAASHLQHETRQLLRAVEQGRLGRSELLDFASMAASSAELVLSNLGRASDLVRSFKQVAVDQSSEQRRSFLLGEYLQEILLSLRPRLKKTRHQVLVDCDPSLRLSTYPGALYQIIVNLIINSLIHGFDGIEAGQIRISAHIDGDALLLRYTDNGRGMNAEVRQRIFDPFYTTRRKEGGSGLGMHLVFNLVTQMLKGSIECRSEPGAGVLFEIAMPGAVEE
jgi:ligand-binding sensor domain-containing protein/signal transduction histidine kinase